jgi:Tol biopolymer transport system component
MLGRTGGKALSIVALSVALAAVVASPSLATAPGRNGLILFLRPVGAHDQVFTARADGTHVRQLTYFRDSGAADPSWSVDGRRIAFARDYDAGKPSEHLDIDTMNSDGSGLRGMGLNGLNGKPLWFPDGRRILFGRIAGLYVISAGGGAPHRVLKISGDYNNASIAPNGRDVVLLRYKGRGSALFVADLGNGRTEQITPWSLGADEKIDWSPDGSRVLSRNTKGVFTVRPDGTGLTMLMRGTDYCSESFSPDGTKVLFIDHCSTAGRRSHLLTMNLDGTGVERIANLPGHWASWDSASS